MSADDEEDVENVSLCSSSDYTKVECTDDQNCWNLDIEKDEIHPIIIEVWKNPLFDESALDSEVINDNSYWYRSNPPFKDNPMST